VQTLKVAMLTTEREDSYSVLETERALVLLRALSSIALRYPGSCPLLRRRFLETALLSKLASTQEIKEDLVRLLAIISRSGSKPEIDSERFVSFPFVWNWSHFLCNSLSSKQPLHDPDFSTACESIVRPKLKSESNDSKYKGLAALSLVLHAIPQVGQSLVASDEILSTVVDIAVFGQSDQRVQCLEFVLLQDPDALCLYRIWL
jgi:hypothetical protein